MKVLLIGLVTLFVLFSFSTSYASRAGEANPFSFYVSYGSLSLDSESAQQAGLSDSAKYLRLGFEGEADNWILGLGFSRFNYSDSEEYREFFGSGKDSGASATNLYAENGYSFKAEKYFQFDILAGVEIVLDPSRSSSDCFDCDNSSFDIDSGFYVMQRAKFELPIGISFYLNMKKYIGTDTDRAVSMGIGYTF